MSCIYRVRRVFNGRDSCAKENLAFQGSGDRRARKKSASATLACVYERGGRGVHAEVFVNAMGLPLFWCSTKKLESFCSEFREALVRLLFAGQP